MKKIAISMCSRVFAESIFLMLRQTGSFYPVKVTPSSADIMAAECRTAGVEIVLMEVSSALPYAGLNVRLKAAEIIRKQIPGCKIVLLCDEVSNPELAREIMMAKQTGEIDLFFYASVTAEYISAMLEAL